MPRLFIPPQLVYITLQLRSSRNKNLPLFEFMNTRPAYYLLLFDYCFNNSDNEKIAFLYEKISNYLNTKDMNACCRMRQEKNDDGSDLGKLIILARIAESRIQGMDCMYAVEDFLREMANDLFRYPTVE